MNMMKMKNTLLILSICCASMFTATAQRLSDEAVVAKLEGTWEGPLVRGRDESNLALTFSTESGVLAAKLFSASMGMYGLPIDQVELEGYEIRVTIPRLDAIFTGTLRFEAGELVRIDADWLQQSELVPVTLLAAESPSF